MSDAESAAVLDGRRRLRRRRLLRVGVPLVGVALVVASVLAIALYGERENKAGALALTEDLLLALDLRVEQEVAGYLDPAARAAGIARDLFAGRALPETEDGSVGRYAAAVLRQLPQVSLFSAADRHGNYLFVRRGPDGGTETKRIFQVPGPRQVVWERRNAAGELLGTEEDPADTFDARTRPWFRGALEAANGGAFWTEVYVFFSSRAPGVTVSVPVEAEGGRGVVGLDISLESLSAFLAKLSVGRNGRAMIVDAGGRLVAHPNPSRAVQEAQGALSTVRLDALGDPLLARVFDHMRVERQLTRILEVDGQRQVVAVNPINAGRGWSVLLAAPESDFTGFVAANNRTGLVMSSAVVALCGLLALLLARQGLRADRAALALLDRTEAIGAQSRAFAALAGDASVFDPGSGRPPPALTEQLAAVTGARRASLWRLSADARTLFCEDAFDRETGGHTAGVALSREELPQFCAALARGEPIAAPDAAAEPDTAELHRVWLHPLGSTGLYAVPVMRRGALAGAVWVEDAAVEEREAAGFVRAVANMVALRLAEAAPADAGGAVAARRPAVPASAPAAAAEGRPDTARGLLAELAARRIDRRELAAEVFPEVAVMVLRLTDPLGLARRPEEGAASPLLDRLACAVQECAEARGIGYAALLGDQLVVAEGFGGARSGAEAAGRVASVALEMRDRCAALLEESDRRLEYRVGLDLGVAIGSPVGREPRRVFNLWGDAVRTADRMAASAPPGGIQATEAAYAALRESFLFRPRGSFYLSRVGEMRCFVLAGSL